MKKTILKTVFSTLLTGVIVTGTVFAFTNTVPYKQDNQVVSAAEWNTIKTTIDNLKNSVNLGNYFTKNEALNTFIDASDLTACKTWEVAKMTLTGFICVADNGGIEAYTKAQADAKFIDASDLTACSTGQVAKMTSTGFVCVEDQKWGSNASLPSCGSNQYLTTSGGNFVCKNLPTTSWGSSLTACPPYKVHVHDDSRNNDEYLSYIKCIPQAGKVIIQIPRILDDYGDSDDDAWYMKNDINLAKTVCKHFGFVYESHTSQSYSATRHIKISNNVNIPYDQDGWNISSILSNVTCAVATVDATAKFYWGTTSGGSGWGWSGGNPTPKYDMK